ncbi:MAG: carboxypeptidase regulatory-like domain-containing protein [Bacteroidales bacterium]
MMSGGSLWRMSEHADTKPAVFNFGLSFRFQRWYYQRLPMVYHQWKPAGLYELFPPVQEFILEISDTKLLPVSQLDAHWEYNYRRFNYMGQALFGVTGTVTDVETGEPLKAQVFIENHDVDSSMVFSMAETGKYFRPLYTGSYDITFSAIGHYPVTFEDVTVQNYELLVLDVEHD